MTFLRTLNADSQHFILRVARARHDLHNSIGHIHGFSEMWLEEFQQKDTLELRRGLEQIHQLASRMIARTTESLQPATLERNPGGLLLLQQLLCDSVSGVFSILASISGDARSLNDTVLEADLSRIKAAAGRIREVAQSSLSSLLSSDGSEADPSCRSISPYASLLSANSDPISPQASSHEGIILIVDDLEENRELLARRLSRIGFSVHTVSSGDDALQLVQSNPVDVILLDILMPGLDGFEVLRRLKENPLTRHIPVVMLSSEDQIETVVRCIKLGADDFLPKPFNPTLLTARVESSLARKRARDKETALLQRIQAERNISERLLLNILPGAIANRLKQGETIIADSFSDVTVLFADFVNFTRASSHISPKLLVSSLNEIFSKFDLLCETHGLEKIKMVGDAYMAVAGLPAPMPNHACAAADLALDMQTAAGQFSFGDTQPCRMRIGIHSGPVVAGVIGTKKFAYDLWGDTVNLASRMEHHAPPCGILVTAETYSLLKPQYSFKRGRLIRVKGKGQILTHLLTGRKANHQKNVEAPVA